RALNVIHEAFFEERKRIAIVLLGIGNVGSAVVERIQGQHSALRAQGFDVRLCGIGNSKRFLFDRDGLDLSSWRKKLAQSDVETNLGEIAQRIEAESFTNCVLVDCTASAKVVQGY